MSFFENLSDLLSQLSDQTDSLVYFYFYLAVAVIIILFALIVTRFLSRDKNSRRGNGAIVVKKEGFISPDYSPKKEDSSEKIIFKSEG